MLVLVLCFGRMSDGWVQGSTGWRKTNGRGDDQLGGIDGQTDRRMDGRPAFLWKRRLLGFGFVGEAGLS